jgi:hypothetical protein
MCVKQLNILVGTAVINRGTREALLNGQRAEIIEDYALTNEEREFVLGIKAETVQEFAQALETWLDLQAGNGRSQLGAHPRLRWG